MIITVAIADRHWQLVAPQQSSPIPCSSGAEAYDTAVALAQEHHVRTGEDSRVRIEFGDAAVEVLHLAARMPAREASCQ